MEPLIFGKYRIARRLAVGGMGEVFLARQVGIAGFDRPVILKSLLPDLSKDQAFVQQFLDEARVASTLNHPNVISIFEVGAWEGTYFLAMEYVPGWNLAEVRRSRPSQPMPGAMAARIIRDAALGLDHAHRARDVEGRLLSIVHRDVSPQNIMVRRDGVTKVVDFGIARAANRATRTETGQIKGKLAYMAPEQLRGEPIDASADQFALGVVLWELLTGRSLFRSETDLATVQKVLTGRAPRIDSVPAELADVVWKMTEPGRDRFASCADVAEVLGAFVSKHAAEAAQLDALLGEVAAHAPLVAPTPTNFIEVLKQTPEASPADVFTASSVTVSQRAPPSRRRLVVIAAASVLAAAGTGAWALSRRTVAVVPSPAPRETLVTAEVEHAGVALAPPAPAPGPAPVAVAAVEPKAPRPSVPRPKAAPRPPLHEKPPAPAVEPAAVAGPGTLTVSSDPWSIVVIDGVRWGSVPQRRELAAGEHHVVFENDEGKLLKQVDIDLKPDEHRKLMVQLSP